MFDNLLDTKSFSVRIWKGLFYNLSELLGSKCKHGGVEWWQPMETKCYRSVKEIGHFYWRFRLVTLLSEPFLLYINFKCFKYLLERSPSIRWKCSILAVFMLAYHRYVPTSRREFYHWRILCNDERQQRCTRTSLASLGVKFRQRPVPQLKTFNESVTSISAFTRSRCSLHNGLGVSVVRISQIYIIPALL